MVVGHGHSAAHAVLRLDALAREFHGTTVVWAVRSLNRRPVIEVADDPLPERRSIAERANALSEAPPTHLVVERRAQIEQLAKEGDALRVTLTGERTHVVDELVGLTGYRPDLAMVSELALEISPASEGGARLSSAIANVTDCLTPPTVEARDLESGEPGFFFIGQKSYGRARTFLLQTGLQQLERIVRAL
jgi:hypothetical protein